MTRVTRVWAKDDPYGTELAEVELQAGRLTATGVAIGIDPLPYRLDYQLTTTDGYVTERFTVRAQGQGWHRFLQLERTPAGLWTCRTENEGAPDLPAPGGDLSGLAEALDCDLGLSPLTNTMPVLRHRLHESGGPTDFLMAWISVPDLAVTPSRQRYAFVRREPSVAVVRFEGLDDGFVAEISFDKAGVVVVYPCIAASATEGAPVPTEA